MIEYESKPMSPAAAFFILLGLMGAGLIMGSIAGVGVWITMTGKSITTLETDMLNPLYANAARMMQIISQFVMFFIPAAVTARMLSRSPFSWLGFREGFNLKQFITVLAMLAAAVYLVSALSALNQAIPLTKSLEATLKKMEDKYNSEAMALAAVHSSGEFIFSLFVMALLPAVFEETFFRGGMQTILISWFKKPMVAIVITSILFSALHVSWYGFLPRFALGMVLGLIYFYSRSIWLNMLLHFLNNAMAVCLMYYYSLHNKPVQDAMNDSSPIWVGLPALIVVVLLLRYFQQVSLKRNIDKIPPMDGPSFESTLV